MEKSPDAGRTQILLSDVLRLSWALYHQDLAMHNAQMDVLLSSPAPRAGERIVVPISLEEEHADTTFVAVRAFVHLAACDC